MSSRGRNEIKAKKTFPWGKLAPLKAQILETPFIELDEVIKDISETVISLDKAELEIMESEEDDDNVDTEDDWDPTIEYGRDENDDEDEKDYSDESEVAELEIEKDYEKGFQISNNSPELEISNNGDSFDIKVRTYEVSSQWGLRRTGNKELDNAGNAVITSLRLRSEILEAVGKYLVDNLSGYLKNLDNHDRHWFLKPLLKSEVFGSAKKSNVTRVVNTASVLLPNGEIEDLNNFFDETKMPVSSKCIALEIVNLIKATPNITNKMISRHIENIAKIHNYNIKLSEEMVRHWRGKYGL